MIRMMIADDEPIIIKGIEKILPWKAMGIEIVATARDGGEAIAQIESSRPDLIISDIQMPGLSGIDLLKYIRREKFNISVIFISGYQDFSYAKEAIHYGAVEYLLKPIKKSSLENAVDKAAAAIRHTSHIEKFQSHVKTEEVKNIIQGIGPHMSEEQLLNRLEAQQLNVRDKTYMGLSLRLLKGDAADEELADFAVFSRADQYLQEKAGGFRIEQDQHVCHYILTRERNGVEGDLETCAEILPELIRQEFGQTLIVGIGPCTEQIKELQHLYKASKFALELYFFLEKEILNYRTINKNYVLSFDDYSSAYQKMMGALLQKKGEPLHELIKCLDIIRELHFGNRDAAIHRCNMMVSEIYAEVQEYVGLHEQHLRKKEHFFQNIQDYESYREVKTAIISMVKEIIEQLKSGTRKKSSLLIKELKDYMREHYMENLTLEQIAGQACMNPYYFSSFFKKETGENFKNYLTGLRMEQAYKLAVGSEMRTYEIADAVGYGNVRQFSEKFREYYGMSLQQLRKERGGK